MDFRRALRDARWAARVAELRYVCAGEPGIRRVKRGRGFVYFDPRGRSITDAATLLRIRALAIPPAWQDVWICARENGHVQAIGRDARGRKQYRYHSEWRAFRDRAKYHGVVPFAHALPKLRTRVQRDLHRPHLDKHKVSAIAVRVLDETAIRVGNDRYTRLNRSFGLTTLRDHHARPHARGIELAFVGKAGIRRRVRIDDARLATLVLRCRDIPGQRLLQYYDDGGHRRALGSADVNRYLFEATGQAFTAKEFRTWHACVAATLLLAAEPAPTSLAAGRRTVNRALSEVAAGLGNTLAVAKRCYVHPAIVDAYLAGSLHHDLELAFAERRRPGLRPDESAVLAFLERQLEAPQVLAA